jgi:hypothetical protein
VVKSLTVPGKCFAISDGDRPGNPNKNGNHDTTCTVNMAQASNAAPVSNQGFNTSN